MSTSSRMDVGLLWYDDDARKPLEKKIDEAAARFREKFGRSPTTCYVNETTTAITHPRLKVLPHRLIRPNHLWVGVDRVG